MNKLKFFSLALFSILILSSCNRKTTDYEAIEFSNSLIDILNPCILSSSVFFDAVGIGEPYEIDSTYKELILMYEKAEEKISNIEAVDHGEELLEATKNILQKTKESFLKHGNSIIEISHTLHTNYSNELIDSLYDYHADSIIFLFENLNEDFDIVHENFANKYNFTILEED